MPPYKRTACTVVQGYSGNGVQCEGRDGLIGENPAKQVTVEMDLVGCAVYISSVLTAKLNLRR